VATRSPTLRSGRKRGPAGRRRSPWKNARRATQAAGPSRPCRSPPLPPTIHPLEARRRRSRGDGARGGRRSRGARTSRWWARAKHRTTGPHDDERRAFRVDESDGVGALRRDCLGDGEAAVLVEDAGRERSVRAAAEDQRARSRGKERLSAAPRSAQQGPAELGAGVRVAREEGGTGFDVRSLESALLPEEIETGCPGTERASGR